MAEFLVCPSCGFLIGSYVTFITKASQALYQETIYSKESKYKDYDPEKLALNPGSAVPLEDIFDALEVIPRRCCRMRITTITRIDKINYK
jgi:hypothetical protein